MAGHRPFSELKRELENKLKGTKVENEEETNPKEALAKRLHAPLFMGWDLAGPEHEELNYALSWNSSGTAMTATEILERQREAYFRLKLEMDAKSNPAVDKFVDEVQRRVADAMGLAPARYPQITADSLRSAYDYLRIARRDIDPGNVSIVIPEKDFLALYATFSRKLDDNMSSMRIFGMEILRGTSGVTVWLPQNVVEPDREAVCMEILSRLGRDTVSELPQSASGNGVSPRAKPVSEVGIAPRPASGDNRDSNSLTHLSDEAKVIAAKEAIAAYARKKQLPSAAHLAVFGELDSKAPRNKIAAASAAHEAKPSTKRQRIFDLALSSEAEESALAIAAIRAGCRSIDDIDRYHHGLSSEPLSRAIDQIWVRENGGAYADLICSRAERLAEMVNRGNSATDGERG